MPCFSPAILREYSDVLLRPRFGFPADEVDALMGLFHRHGGLFEPVPIGRSSPDPDDDEFIACVLAARADFLVTGNKRHFPQTAVVGARVVNAAELLELITLEL